MYILSSKKPNNRKLFTCVLFAKKNILILRLTINLEKKDADQGMLAFIRVYTADIVGDTVGVIGSCLVPFFTGKVRYGIDNTSNLVLT